MLFNSYIFIFTFLPLAFVGYFLLNRLQQYTTAKLFLTAMSLWFYAYFHISYLGIILVSIILNYICHLLLTRQFHPKAVLILGLLGNIGILFYFKYFRFVLENINHLFSSQISLPEILLPLGISFFTFQQIAFLIDTAAGKVSRQPLTDYMLFVTFFPQLIAGPIVSHEEMLPQFQDLSLKKPCAENCYKGFQIFVLGLTKKVLLADTFGQAVNWGFQNYTMLNSLETILVILFYTLQIYLDFSGYCDMARGIGYLFNIKLPVNFLAPYRSVNILEFWDRWHITLTRFFTRYLYIPLGGSRKGFLRTCINVMIVFLVSGIWHGAGWTFIFWGLLHGFATVLTRCFHQIKQKLALPHCRLARIPAGILTFVFTALAWTFFRADTIGQAVEMLKTAFSFTGSTIRTNLSACFQLPEFFYVMKFFRLNTLPYAAYYCMLLLGAAAILFTFFCPSLCEAKAQRRPSLPATFGLSFLFVWCVLSLSSVSTFLYFNF